MTKEIKKNIKKRIYSALFLVFVSTNVFSQTPYCYCDDYYDPFSDEYALCYQNNCGGEIIIPVNGNIWILIASGIGFAFYQFRSSKNKEEEQEK
ncbi:MAG TPA: hypothetical protein DCR46_08745 [Cytophagales bacterium]|nr:hypothetical protein [Cytophagales bacterium]